MATTIEIPPGLGFEMLQLSWSENGVTLDFDVIERLCRFNSLESRLFLEDNRKLVALIAAWYAKARIDGTERSTVVEKLMCGAASSEERFAVV